MSADLAPAFTTGAQTAAVSTIVDACAIVTWHERADAGEELTGAWRSIADHPLEPAAGAIGDWLAPQLAGLAGNGPWRIAAIDPARHGCGFLHPFVIERHRWAMSAGCLTSWRTDFTFSGQPLIGATDPERAIGALISTLPALGVEAMLLPNVAAAGPFADAVRQATNMLGVPFAVHDPRRRAGLECTTRDFEDWLKANHSRKRRKEFRRLAARLAEQGDMRFQRLRPGDDLAPWLNQFLALEASGWKGRRKTAIACSPAMTSAVRQALGDFHANGNLRFWRLGLDGRPVAMLFALVHHRRAWLGKIAYADAFARYSPGVLVTLRATADMLADGAVDRVDSCAIPDHPMIDHLWRDRIAVCDLLIGAPGLSPARFALLDRAETARRKLRGAAKTVFNKLLGRPRR